MKKLIKIILLFLLFIIILINNVIKADDTELFPIDYKTKIIQLKNIYPNWQFRIHNTGLNYYDVLEEESKNNKNLVPTYASDSLKSKISTDYNILTNSYIEKDRGWVSANELVLSYFIDPRNFLNEKHILEFESLEYNEIFHTQEGVEKILENTFMSNSKIKYFNMLGDLIETDETYSNVIMEAAKQANISPYFLASKIRQEVGINGSSSISGKFLGYEGIYNFYNIGATDGVDAIKNGLTWAINGTTYERPWLTPKLSIIGGAKYISSSYINLGQTTRYLQKFNVNQNSFYPLYTHQYMTNVVGATSEAALSYNASLQLNDLANMKIFWIPVYYNMPDLNASLELNKETDNQIGTVNADNLKIRTGPGISYDLLDVSLNSNDQVTIIEGLRTNVDYNINYIYYPYWYKISFLKNGRVYIGYVAAKYININPSLNIDIGNIYKLNYKIISNNIYEKIYFESTNMDVATVSDDGIVTPLKEGIVTINAYVGSKMESISIYSNDPIIHVQQINLNYNNVNLTIGNKKQLTYNVSPTNSTIKAVNWASMDNSVATVSNGLITALKPGKTYIKAISKDNSVTSSCLVNVSLEKPYISSINVNSYNSLKINYNKVPGATGYIIYRSNSLYGVYNYINTTSNLNFIDKNLKTNQKYYYKIRVYKIINNKKYYYSYSNIRDKTPIINKTNVSLYNYSLSKFKIKWTKIPYVTGYIIYRSTSKYGYYKRIKIVNNNSLFYFIDSNLNKGVRYYYQIQVYKTINNTKIYSKKSDIKSLIK